MGPLDQVLYEPKGYMFFFTDWSSLSGLFFLLQMGGTVPPISSKSSFCQKLHHLALGALYLSGGARHCGQSS